MVASKTESQVSDFSTEAALSYSPGHILWQKGLWIQEEGDGLEKGGRIRWVVAERGSLVVRLRSNPLSFLVMVAAVPRYCNLLS